MWKASLQEVFQAAPILAKIAVDNFESILFFGCSSHFIFHSSYSEFLDSSRFFSRFFSLKFISPSTPKFTIYESHSDYFKIMAVSGHKTMAVFERYNLVTEEELKHIQWEQDDSPEGIMDTK